MKPSIISLAALLIAVIWTSSVRADTPVHIEISNTSVCALTDAGEIVCWGFPSTLTADEPKGAFTDIALGPNDGCAISADATVSCWGQGYDYVRAQADGMSEEVLRLSGVGAMLPPDRNDLVEVAVHPWRHYACARTIEGAIECWGDSAHDSSPPSGDGFVQLISTGRELCALDSDGATTCWSGMAFADYVAPDVGPFATIHPSGNGLCGVTEAGDVRCRTATARPAPGSPQPYAQIFRNVHLIGAQGCAVQDNGQIQCRQTHHYCHHVVPAEHEFCPLPVIRFRTGRSHSPSSTRRT